MKLRISAMIFAMVATLTVSAQQAQSTKQTKQQPKYQQGGQPPQPAGQPKYQQGSQAAATSKAGKFGTTLQFSGVDQQTIRTCMTGTYGQVPRASRRPLPADLDKQIQVNSTLPSAAQSRVQPLPELCSSKLTALPPSWSRVLVGNHVLLLDPNQKITDMFNLN